MAIQNSFICLGLLCQALFTLALASASSPVMAVICLVAGGGLGTALVWSSFMVNQLDIAPRVYVFETTDCF